MGASLTSAESQEQSELNTALVGRYVLERALGRGGMATVFLARDAKHGGRTVAFKVLATDRGVVLGPERFRREIATAARLQHPHVLPVFDSGNAAGRLWFTMPYVEGESLRERLARERQLSISDALRITREVAQGLHYAHRHGVLHRDVKPENILLTEDGTTLVADFGIAASLGEEYERTDHGGDTQLTGTGLAIGTPAYMSPEQSSGARDLDARSDVYALGAVLYEMLVGEPPFTGPTMQAVVAKRLSTVAPSVRVTRPTISPELESAVARALCTVPSDRFATAADFAAALDAARTASEAPSPVAHAEPARSRGRSGRPTASLAVAATLVMAGALFLWSRTGIDAGKAERTAQNTTPNSAAGSGTGTAASTPIGIAVLPFENLGREEDAYVTDGLTDEIRAKLSSVPGMQVIARASSNEYRASRKSPEQIAAELGVRYLLTGTVRTEAATATRAARLRVSPELVEIASGRAPVSRWTQPFDAETLDVFAMQASIASRVAAAMDIALGSSTRAHLAEVPTTDAAAYDAFLRGESAADALSASEPTALRKALGFYTQAVSLDSTFSQAWAQRARAAAQLYFNGIRTTDLARETRRAADRALALAPTDASGHHALGDYYLMIEQSPARALAAYEEGRRIAPGVPGPIYGVASAELGLGRLNDAVRDYRVAAALDPRSARTARRLASALLWARRYDHLAVKPVEHPDTGDGAPGPG